MNDSRQTYPRLTKWELVERFHALTGPELMALAPEEKEQLFPVAHEIIFPGKTITTEKSQLDARLDMEEKALVLLDKSKISGELLEKHVNIFSQSILHGHDISPFRLHDISTFRSMGLRGSLQKMVGELAVRKKELPDRPSTGTMVFGFVSAALLAVVLLLLIFHPGVSTWFNEKASAVILPLIAILVTLGVLIVTGSFIGGGIGFFLFALVTWLINKVIPLQIFLKVLTVILLGLGAMLMFILGKGEADGFREGKDREYEEQANALVEDIVALREYVRHLKHKAECAKDYVTANKSGELRDLLTSDCKVVSLYYKVAEEKLDELLKGIF